MGWLVYLFGIVGIVVGLALGFFLSGLWIIAVPRWRQRRRPRDLD